MDFDKKIKSLMRKNPKDPFEPNYFIYGLIVILNQFHPTNKEVFLGTGYHNCRLYFPLHQEHHELYYDKQGG